MSGNSIKSEPERDEKTVDREFMGYIEGQHGMSLSTTAKRLPGAGVAICVAGLLTAAGSLFTITESHQNRTARELRLMTGAETKVVWCQQAAGARYDVEGSQLILMGLDTTEPGGPRPLLRRAGSYWKPKISPRGDRVVFTDFRKATIYVVNWNGSSLRELAGGYALSVWMDPATAQEWVYAVAEAGDRQGGYAGKPVFRFQLDNPFKREMVWDTTLVTFENLRISRDGKKAGGLFPWPQAGVADLESKTWREYGRGCWADLSPDSSHVSWVFDGAHRNLTFCSADGRKRWKTRLDDAPGLAGGEVDCPRWSNHIRFMTMKGPHRRGDQTPGKVDEIYVGKFDEGLSRVEQWVRVTHNELVDSCPDVWVDPAIEMGWAPGAVRQRGSGERLEVKAHLVETTMTPTLGSIAPYRQALVVYAYEVDNVVTGTYRHARLLVAHWGLLGGQVRPIPRTRGMSYQMTVAPLDDIPKLEGERVIMDMKADNLPVYYEINR